MPPAHSGGRKRGRRKPQQRTSLPEPDLGPWVEARGFKVRGQFLPDEPCTFKIDLSKHPAECEMTGVWGRREVMTAAKFVELCVYRLKSARAQRDKEQAALQRQEAFEAEQAEQSEPEVEVSEPVQDIQTVEADPETEVIEETINA